MNFRYGTNMGKNKSNINHIYYCNMNCPIHSLIILLGED